MSEEGPLLRGPAVGRALAASGAVVLFLLFIPPRDGWIIDDALIYQNYVRNAAAGHGIVYGPGAAVEGFSSPLWVVLLTLLALAGASGFVAAKAHLFRFPGFIEALLRAIITEPAYNAQHC